jgi:hypothetical protein
MKNLLPLVLAVALGVACFIPAQAIVRAALTIAYVAK